LKSAPWRDLDDLGGGEHRLGALAHAGVQVTHDTSDVALAGEGGRGVLADVWLGLVVLDFDLDGPARDGVGGVGLLDRKLDRVLDAKTESRQVTGHRCHDADLDGLVAARRAGARIAGAACRKGQRRNDQRRSDPYHGTLVQGSSWIVIVRIARATANPAGLVNLSPR